MAHDAGSQHTVSLLTVNTVKTVSWLALAILGSASWHDEVMTADEFLSVLSVFGEEKVNRCTAISVTNRGHKDVQATSPFTSNGKWQIRVLDQCHDENSLRQKMHNLKEKSCRWEMRGWAMCTG